MFQSYLELDMYVSLTVHTESTIAAEVLRTLFETLWKRIAPFQSATINGQAWSNTSAKKTALQLTYATTLASPL